MTTKTTRLEEEKWFSSQAEADSFAKQVNGNVSGHYSSDFPASKNLTHSGTDLNHRIRTGAPNVIPGPNAFKVTYLKGSDYGGIDFKSGGSTNSSGGGEGPIDIEGLRSIRDTLPSLEALSPAEALYTLITNGSLPEDILWKMPLDQTQVGLTPSLRNTIDLTNDLVTGETGIFRELLNGKPDFRGLALQDAIERRNFNQFGVPAIQDRLSAGPLGAGYSSGNTDRILAQSFNQISDAQAGRRFQAGELAKDRSLQAVSQIPALAQVQALEQDVAFKNMQNRLQTHFQNQGLELEEARFEAMMLQQALAEGGLLVNQEQFTETAQIQRDQINAQIAVAEAELAYKYEALDFEKELANENLRAQLQAQEDAKKLSVSNLVGTGVGAIGGFLIGGPGGASLGASIGGGFGTAAGGGGYQSLASSIAAAPLNYYMMNTLMPNAFNSPFQAGGFFNPGTQLPAAGGSAYGFGAGYGTAPSFGPSFGNPTDSLYGAQGAFIA